MPHPPSLQAIGVNDRAWRLGHRLALAVVIFGVMGAAVSGILSTAKGTVAMRIPEQLFDSWITIARMAMAAMAALAVTTFLFSRILVLGSLNLWLVLAAAFASGFSERLVLRAVEAVSKEPAQKSTQGPPTR